MREGGERPGAGRPRARPIVYCLIPHELAPTLHELLRRHFARDAGVTVVVERRRGDRRSGAEQRVEGGEEPGRERRLVRSPMGRRVGERRAPLIPIDRVPVLPRRARPYAERLTFVERLEPSSEHAADLDAGRLVVRFQAGETDAFTEIYLRYFDPVYAYVRVGLGEHHAAEDLTQQVFIAAFEGLPKYELRPGKPFRAWLFKIARNEVLDHLRKQGRLEVEDPNHIDQRRELDRDAEADIRALEWISDRDLMLFIERLPEPQRRSLILRYMIGLSTDEIALVMERSPVAVRKLEHRALRFLEKRLTAIGRAPRASRRAPTLVRLRRLPVVRSRRFALNGATVAAGRAASTARRRG